MKAEFSIKLISYFAPNCPRRIVAQNCPRRIVQRRIVRAELSAPNCPAPNCPGTCITSVLYRFKMMFLSLLTTVLLIMPRTLFALADASVHCLDGLALSCIITPKSFSSSIWLILLLSISYSNLQFLLPTCMTAHLSMLNGMFQSFDHLCSLSKSPLRAMASSSLFTLAQSFVSSANLDIFDTVPSSMSLIYITNNSGPSTDP